MATALAVTASSTAPRVYGLDAICAAAWRSAATKPPGSRAGCSRVADKDLAAAPPEQRGAAALALLAFARRRLPGIAKVRVFNPIDQGHGFESRHTVIHVVNDDMPFLVDSIANELNRREISVHLLAHPVLTVRRDLDGDLLDFGPDTGERSRPESMMHIEIDRQAAASSTSLPPRSPACWPRCGWRLRTGGRCAAPASSPSPTSPPAARRALPNTTTSCAGWRPTISPSWAIAAIAMSRTPRKRAACATN
jgi:hypothetical protein